MKTSAPPFEPEPLAVIDPPSEEVADILARHVQYEDAGITFIGEPLTFDQWEKTLEFYQTLRSKSSWMIGDCLNYGERYGEKYAQAVDIGKSVSRLQTIASVCSRFSHERRNPRLSFTLHEKCAYILPTEGDRLLKEAELKRWSTADMIAEVAKLNELNGAPPKKTRKSSGTAAKVAASGKSPVEANQQPTLPVIAPATVHGLFWNRYQLTAKETLIYQGSEPIPEEEAHRAGRYYGFDSGFSLYAWLHQNGFTNPTDKTPEPPVSASPVAPSSPAEPAPVTPQPNPTPSPTAPNTGPTEAAEQALALQLCEAALNRFIEATQQVKWEGMPKLAMKRWLKMLDPADTLIDTLAKAIQGVKK